MRTIAISAGHGSHIRGASGYLDEVDEARKVCTRVCELLFEEGIKFAGPFFDDTSTSQDQNLHTIVNWHNQQRRDLDVSIHFNAYQTTAKPMGHETLYVTQEALAANIAAAVARAGAFLNRGAKKRTDLYFLNATDMPAVLLEVCFVDSSADTELYRDAFDAICLAIAETIADVSLGEAQEPPPIIIEPPPDEIDKNHVDITANTTGNVIIELNGEQFVHGSRHTLNRLYLTLRIEGDVRVTINGQDYHGVESEEPPQVKENHRDIICTVFGGLSDPNYSAYDEHFINDTELGVALPYKFDEPRPKVRVFNAENELSVLCEIVDVGPWHTDDEQYVLGDARPDAEPAGSIIDGGPNDGEVSNGAGIDLTPGAADAIELEGKGVVHWMFEPDQGEV